MLTGAALHRLSSGPVQAASASLAVLLEEPARVLQRRLRVLEQHVAPAAQDAVERRGGLVDRDVEVDLPEADVLDALALRSSLRRGEHLGHEVGR